MFQISIANLIIIVKKSCRWTYTFQFTFSTVHASAFVFMEVGMPKRFRPDLKKISNRNLIHFCSKSDPNLTKNSNFSNRNMISSIPNFPKIWMRGGWGVATFWIFRTYFVQISVQNISDFCSESDSILSNVSSASSTQKICQYNYLRALPKVHIGFERKSARFLSDFDQISVPNLIDSCSNSEPNLNFCPKNSED